MRRKTYVQRISSISPPAILELDWNEIIERDVSTDVSEDRINFILIFVSIFSSLVILSLLTKILIVLPNNIPLVVPLVYTRFEGEFFSHFENLFRWHTFMTQLPGWIYRLAEKLKKTILTKFGAFLMYYYRLKILDEVYEPI